MVANFLVQISFALATVHVGQVKIDVPGYIKSLGLTYQFSSVQSSSLSHVQLFVTP